MDAGNTTEGGSRRGIKRNKYSGINTAEGKHDGKGRRREGNRIRKFVDTIVEIGF